MKHLAGILLLTSFAFLSNAQTIIDGTKHQETYQLHIGRTQEPVVIDGDLKEAAWKTKNAANGFWQKWPIDTSYAHRQTEVRMTDDKNIYIGVIAYDTNYHVIQTLRRDSRFFDNDAFTVIIDPVNQRTNGFMFQVNAYNVQSEDIIFSGTEDFNLSWDNKWFSKTKLYNDRWTAEIAIPFKTLRYQADKKIWGIQFFRNDVKNNEYSTWTRMTVNFEFNDLGYTGALVWDDIPPPPGTNISFIPYAISTNNINNQTDGKLISKANAGFDAKVAITPSLNLDLTANPDFSQVEVDRQVTNLTRFSIFFPERRNFFLENDDVFSSFGIPPIRPYFSRRIGLGDNAQPIPIIGGARLSGNLTKKLRVGLLSMQTGRTDDYIPANYSSVAFSQRVLDRSLIKGYFHNRSTFMTDDERRKDPLNQYGRNAGIELNFVDKPGLWQGWAGYHYSWKPNIAKDNVYWNAGGTYSGRSFNSVVDVSVIGTDFYADMGFLQRIENYDAEKDTTVRLGYAAVFNETSYVIYPKKGKINQHSIGLETFAVFNPDGSFNERTNSLSYEIGFKNTSEFSINIENQQLKLLFPFRFTSTGDALPKAMYNFTQAELNYETDGRKTFAGEAGIRYGSFYNGTLFQLSSRMTYRVQPWGNFSLNLEYNRLQFPERFGSTSIFLVSPRIEINFSTSVFWTTFLQLNTQNNNFNINSRFQWRFKPMSDLFIVYTDNYFTDPLFKNKNRGVVLKFQYWLNL
jgi:Domain of unknown function (DUF5916)/Carbohydrate family 9 binding domain-like